MRTSTMYESLTDQELEEAFEAISLRAQELSCHREESPVSIGHQLWRNATRVLNLVMDELEYRMEQDYE